MTDDQTIAKARSDYLKSLPKRLQDLYSHAAMIDRQCARAAFELNQPLLRGKNTKQRL